MVISRRDSPSGVCILDLEGNLTIGDGAAPLRDYVESLAEQGVRKVLLNLRKVSHIDSSGIGSVVAAYSTLAQKKGDLKLLGVDPKLAPLISAVAHFDNEAEAIQSFASKPSA